jgi:hypothetical protein
MDFTLQQYRYLLYALKKKGYKFKTFDACNFSVASKVVVLRHDVDRLPINAIVMAEVEHALQIHASYYFRAVSSVFNTEIMQKISKLGHEIGYHYEDLSLTNGNIDKAYDSFCRNLEKFRKIYPVKTICMHGSPRSKWDSRRIWDKYDYKKLGIIGEPYFDIDYNEVFYITDTGRKWNKESISVRDKVNSGFDIPIKNTQHLIRLIQQDQLPVQIMLNVHPHRWFDNYWGWTKELVMQNVKNVIKRMIIKYR